MDAILKSYLESLRLVPQRKEICTGNIASIIAEMLNSSRDAKEG